MCCVFLLGPDKLASASPIFRRPLHNRNSVYRQAEIKTEAIPAPGATGIELETCTYSRARIPKGLKLSGAGARSTHQYGFPRTINRVKAGGADHGRVGGDGAAAAARIVLAVGVLAFVSSVELVSL